MSVVYQDGTTPLDAAHMNALQQKVEKGLANGYASLDSGGKIPAAQIPLTVVSYGTTLPASPVDGQEAILVDSTTNPTYQWRFRYNAGSTSAYKWECVGATPLGAYLNVQESLAVTGTWQDLATVGPQVTVPRAGDYQVRFGARVVSAGTGLNGYLGVKVGATAPSGVQTSVSVPASAGIQAMFEMLPSYDPVLRGIAASTTIGLQYQTNVATAYFGYRMIQVQPTRVS